jgi:ABC-type glycerol-3-phosphate transport system permease component
MRQFFLSIPDSLQEAAEIDGCGYARMFIIIFLPMVTHAIITLALIRVVAVWNDFLWPLIATNRDVLRTVPVAIATVFFNYRNIDWAGLTAASSIALLPLVTMFLFTRDYIIESIAVTGFK